MISISDSIGPNQNGLKNIARTPNGHLVYIGMVPRKKFSFRIHASGHTTSITSKDNEFVVILQSMTVEYNSNIHKAQITVQELGWFEDVDLFTEICRDQPVPSRPGSVFHNWISDVFDTVATHHANLWSHNNGTCV
jgi:hypothetical protein